MVLLLMSRLSGPLRFCPVYFPDLWREHILPQHIVTFIMKNIAVPGHAELLMFIEVKVCLWYTFIN